MRRSIGEAGKPPAHLRPPGGLPWRRSAAGIEMAGLPTSVRASVVVTGKAIFLAIFLGIFLAGCTSIRPTVPPGTVPLHSGDSTVSHADLDQVLQRFVDAEGRVDYPALAADPSALDRYYARIAAVSPDSHPERFPTDDDRLAYWLNAYNAAVLSTVLRYYPIASVRDVRPPVALFFLPRLSGFFVFQRITLGGQSMSLYHLENGIVRKRFNEPRIHFALNCASTSCPRLPRAAFTAADLDAELARETRRFMTDPRNVRIDLDARRIELSAIFDWYDRDFLDWLAETAPDEEPTLPAYVARYLPADQAARLGACRDCPVVFLPYDWALNDRRLGP